MKARRGRRALVFALAPLSIACAAILDLPDPKLDPTIGPDASTAADGATNNPDVDGATIPGSDGSTPIEAAACEGIELKDSGSHCGTCNHDCLGGQCLDGKCQPVLLADNQGRPTDLAVDDTYVFWPDYQTDVLKSVVKASPSGPLNVVNALATGVADLRGVEADGEFVYFTVETFTPPGGVHRCPRTGCAPDASTLIAPANYGFDVIAYKGELFYSGRNEGKLRTSHIDGTNPIELGTGITQPRYVAADDLHAYCTSAMNQVEAYPRDGGASFAIGPLPGIGNGIATDGERVIWADELPDGGGTIRIHRVGTATALAIAFGTRPKAIALDQTRVYFTFMGTGEDTADGVLASCPRDGCLAAGPDIIVPKLIQPNAMVIDDKAIYYSTAEPVGSSKIWKIAKP